MVSSDNHFTTDSLALCPYLAMNNLHYVGTEIGERGKTIFIFADPKNLGPNLSMDFMKSNERTYKNLWNFFRNELNKKLQPQSQYWERLEN